MQRFMLVTALIVLSGCATVYQDDHGYYSGDTYGGDYYYDPDPWGYDRYGYSAYDSLLWGLRYSYFDPFYYPYFHYGVTFFPSYYGWSYWYAGDYWRWRHFHPYSPYYGSWWDHYYDWHRPGASFDARARLYGRRDRGYGNSVNDPARHGSARNAAERMARQSRPSRAGSIMAVPGRARGYAPDRSATGSSSMHSRSRVGRGPGLQSRDYVPSSRRGGVEPDRWSSSRDPGQFERSADRSFDGGGPVIRTRPRVESGLGRSAGRESAPMRSSGSASGASIGRASPPPSRPSAPPSRSPDRDHRDAGRER